MVRQFIGIVPIIIALTSCAQYCRHQRWEPHRDSCYFRGSGRVYNRDGPIDYARDLYYSSACTGDGLAPRGCREHRH